MCTCSQRTSWFYLKCHWFGGVSAFPYLKMVSTDHTIADIKFELTKMGVVAPGDFVVHLASMPIADAGMTNMVKLSRV